MSDSTTRSAKQVVDLHRDVTQGIDHIHEVVVPSDFKAGAVSPLPTGRSDRSPAHRTAPARSPFSSSSERDVVRTLNRHRGGRTLRHLRIRWACQTHDQLAPSAARLPPARQPLAPPPAPLLPPLPEAAPRPLRPIRTPATATSNAQANSEILAREVPSLSARCVHRIFLFLTGSQLPY